MDAVESTNPCPELAPNLVLRKPMFFPFELRTETRIGEADTIAAVARVARVNFIVLGGWGLGWLLIR